MKPKIIKKISTNKPQESGCCFTSCGGAPLILQFDKENKRKSTIQEILKKIN